MTDSYVNPFKMTARRWALLAVIRTGEGTWLRGSDDGYRVLVGGTLLPLPLVRHPHTIVRLRPGLASSAAGAYQFLSGTWRDLASRANLPDFGPTSQDAAALVLIHELRADPTEHQDAPLSVLLRRINRTWASMPGSPYGQRTKSLAVLSRRFDEQLLAWDRGWRPPHLQSE